MKKLPTKIVVCALLLGSILGSVLVAPVVNAEELTPEGNLEILDAPSGNNIVTEHTDTERASGGTSADTSTSAGAAGNRVVNSAATQGCNLSISSVFQGFNWMSCFATIGGELVIGLVSKVVYFSGVLLNMSLNFTLHIKDLVDGIPMVGLGWRVFRDVSNICFIFLLLWIAINTILGTGGSDTKKTLINIIIFALLLNFSLFITQAIIDASNIMALHFYTLLTPNPADYDGGLSGVFRDGLRISTLFDPSALTASALGQAANNSLKIIEITFFGSIFLLVTAFVFFAAAILFVQRTVKLLFLMILSPLAFMGQVLPFAKKFTGDFWGELFGEAFFAPLYMMLAYIVGATMQSNAFKNIMTIRAGGAAAGGSFTSAIAGNLSSSNVGIILNFFVLIGLMIGCLLIAKKLGAHGSDMVMGWGKALQKKAQGAVVGGFRGAAGGALARSFGGNARKFLDSDKAKDMRAQGGVFNRLRLKAAETAAGSKFGSAASYDDRVKKGTLLRVGKEEVAENIKKFDPERRLQYVRNLADPKLRKEAYEALSVRDRAKLEDTAWKSGSAEDTSMLAEVRNKLPLEEKEKTLEAMVRNYDGKEADLAKYIEQMANVKDVKGNSILSADDIAVMYKKLSADDRAKVKEELITNPNRNKNTEKGADIAKAAHDRLSEEERNKTEKAIKEAKREGLVGDNTKALESLVKTIRTAIAEGITPTAALAGALGHTYGTVPINTEADIKTLLEKIPEKELVELDINELKIVAPYLTNKQTEAIGKSDKISSADAEKIMDERHKELVAAIGAIAGGAATASLGGRTVTKADLARRVETIPEKELGELSMPALKAVAEYLTDKQIETVQKTVPASDAKLVIEAKFKPLADAVSAGRRADVETYVKGLSPKGKAGIPPDLLKLPEVIKHLQSPDLVAMAQKGNLGSAITDVMKREIEDAATDPRNTRGLNPTQLTEFKKMADWFTSGPGKDAF